MPRKPIHRDDFSRFVVHLTRDTDEGAASDNLLKILEQKTIEARNPHCLFIKKIKTGKFDDKLQRAFNTVCFTEAPLNQIRFMVADIPGRSIRLKPFGLVFRRSSVIEAGACPALYLNGVGANHAKFLQRRFDRDFTGIRTVQELRRKMATESEDVLAFYSLCNLISPYYDFSWEREWRHRGDFQFKYYQIVAIITGSTLPFKEKMESKLPEAKLKDLRKVPLINPDWNYERVISEMSQLLKATYKSFAEKSV